jgi:hypothetical protein
MGHGPGPGPAGAFTSRPDDIERTLDSLYRRHVKVEELESRVHALATVLEMSPPIGRKPTDYLGWMEQYSPRAMELLQKKK